MQPSNVIVLLAADTCDEAGGVFFASVVGVDGDEGERGMRSAPRPPLRVWRGEVAVGVVTAPGACERWGQETRIKRFVVRGVSLERGLCACTA